MTIKDTNDPKVLKKYIRYVVSKYHDLAEKFANTTDINIGLHATNACLRLENLELGKDKKSFIKEIKNLYEILGTLQGFEKTVDFLDTDVLNLESERNINSSQLQLFDECDEAPPLIEFNEVNLDNECVDKTIQDT